MSFGGPQVHIGHLEVLGWDGIIIIFRCVRGKEKQGETSTFVFLSGVWASLLVCVCVCVFFRAKKKKTSKTQKVGGGANKNQCFWLFVGLYKAAFSRRRFQWFYFFTHTCGNDLMWRTYFSDGLKQPTSFPRLLKAFLKKTLPNMMSFYSNTPILSENSGIMWGCLVFYKKKVPLKGDSK